METFRSQWDEAALLALIANGVQESLTLDYKRSPSLDRSDGNKRAELSKDVSAFANSAGGTLIYGVEENGHVPTNIDGGYGPNEITKEWLEDVITSTIQPRVEGIRVTQVSLSGQHQGRVAYVIDIPQARSLAPHQALDKRYYRRYNFKSVPMEDYEVRDLMRRASTPDLRCRLLLGLQGAYSTRGNYKRVPVTFIQGQAWSLPIYIQLAVENLSPEPASYAVFTIDCPKALLHVPSVDMRTVEVTGREGTSITRFVRTYGAPNDLPLWQGEVWTPSQARIAVAVPHQYAHDEAKWLLSVAASAPGMQRTQRVLLNYDLHHLYAVHE